MIFGDKIVLENHLVRLQPLAEEDREKLWPLAQESDIWAFTPSKADTRESWDAYFDQALSLREQHQRYPFLIVEKASGQVAGSTSYGNFSIPDRRVEIGWTWLGKPFRGSHLNKACKFLLLSFAFEKMDMQRVELKTDVRNLRSRAAMKSMGAKEEGILRSHTAMHDGHRRDTIYYSILEHEWLDIRASLLKTIYPQ